MARSKIEWLARPGTTPESWNPVTGCTKVSPGCKNCYAERMARRLAGRCGYPPMPHHFDVTLHPERLKQPLRWRKPRTVFVNSMSDLFHENVPTPYIAQIFNVMTETPQHTYIILTKRARTMWSLLDDFYADLTPPPNVWLGVTAENQEMANERIPLLLQTPAAVRFVSVEPMLGQVELLDKCFLGVHREAGTVTEFDGDNVWYKRPGRGIVRHDRPRIDWVIAGGESGPGARPAHPDWFRSLRDQCQEAGVAYFFKQHGAWLHQSQIGTQPIVASTMHCWENDLYVSYRVGKKAAGRLLDGREWNEWPKEIGT